MMKKIVALFLSCLLITSLLSACGGNNAADNGSESSKTANDSQSETGQDTEEPVQEANESIAKEVLLQVGETAEGKICDVTVNSVEYVNAIKDGLRFHMWSPAEKVSYQDVTAEEGYAIIKITYHFDYKGKENGRFSLNLELDYDDGYVFTTAVNHVTPISENGVGFEKTYDFMSEDSFDVGDPLSYKGEDKTTYIIVNEVALTDISKPLVLRIGIPTAPDSIEPNQFGGYDYIQNDPETFIFDLRSIEFDMEAQSEEDAAAEEVYQNAVQLMEQNTWGRIGDAGELFATILDYKDSKDLLIQCYVKGHMNWPDDLEQDFEDVSGEELNSIIIGTWQANGYNDPYIFSEDGTVDKAKSISDWHVEDNLLVIGDFSYTVKKPYDGSLILYYEVNPFNEAAKGEVAERIWKEE